MQMGCLSDRRRNRYVVDFGFAGVYGKEDAGDQDAVSLNGGRSSRARLGECSDSAKQDVEAVREIAAPMDREK